MIFFILYASDIFGESTTTVFLNVGIEITSNISHVLHTFLNEFETHILITQYQGIFIFLRLSNSFLESSTRATAQRILFLIKLVPCTYQSVVSASFSMNTSQPYLENT